MKVMHIITGLSRGGAEGAMLRLVLSDAEHAHCVVSLMNRGVHAETLEAHGIPVYVIGMRRGRVSADGLLRLYRLIRKVKPDLIQTWMYHADLVGGLVGKLAGTQPVVWGIRHSSLDPRKTSLSTQLVARACAALSWTIPSAIVICSAQAVHVHADLGFQTENVVVIANGVDASGLRPDEALRGRVRAEVGAREDEFLLGMVARWDPQKDHATLAEALAHELVTAAGSPRCVLVGPGIESSNAAISALLDRYNLSARVILLGDRADVPAIMNALDLHVLSSAYGEGFPNVAAEAMACGTPCVITDVGDSSLIVAETGWVVPPSDPLALARAINAAALQARRDRPAWEARREASRDRIVTRFSMDRMVQSYSALWRKAAASDCEARA